MDERTQRGIRNISAILDNRFPLCFGTFSPFVSALPSGIRGLFLGDGRSPRYGERKPPPVIVPFFAYRIRGELPAAATRFLDAASPYAGGLQISSIKVKPFAFGIPVRGWATHGYWIADKARKRHPRTRVGYTPFRFRLHSVSPASPYAGGLHKTFLVNAVISSGIPVRGWATLLLPPRSPANKRHPRTRVGYT